MIILIVNYSGMGKLTLDMGMVIDPALVPTILGIFTTMAEVKICL